MPRFGDPVDPSGSQHEQLRLVQIGNCPTPPDSQNSVLPLLSFCDSFFRREMKGIGNLLPNLGDRVFHPRLRSIGEPEA